MMRYHRTLTAALATAALTTLATPDAQAFIILDSTYRYAFSVPRVELAQDQDAQVELFLVETVEVDDPAVTFPLEGEQGLVSVGVKVVRDPLGLQTIAITGATFDDADLPLTSYELLDGVLTVHLALPNPESLPSGVLPPVVAGERWIKLADLTVHTLDDRTQQAMATFIAMDPDAGLDETRTYWHETLDPDIANGTLEVVMTHAPEPASLALMGLGVLAITGGRRRA